MGYEGGIVNDYDDEENSFNFTPRKKISRDTFREKLNKKLE